ncbi:MAG: protein kinase [Candidatus Eisenbacteria bacterium]
MSRKRPKPEPPPRSDEWDDAFLKVSVAVADGSEPDWDEAERIATSPERRSALDELKLIAGIVGRGPDPHYSGRTADPAALTSHLREPLRRPGRAHHEFAPGDRLADRYVIRSLIGRGGFGLVYEAWDEELEIAIAIKVFRLDFGNDSRSLRALKQEALLARAVVHPNICRVYDVGSHRVDEGEVWFLTMELVRGESLLAHLRQRGRLSPGEAWPLVKQMAAGLAKAHEQGIAHLDFKSGNVILQPRGGEFDAILTDFGLARAVDVARATDSLAASAVTLEGTPAYMSPEQVRGEPAGVAADIYAFGVVLYQIVTGALPWTGRTSLDVAQRRLKGDAPRASALVADLDPRWDDAIARCMAREAHARFPGMAELLRALDPTGSEAGPGSDLDAIAVPLPGLPVEPDSLIGREEDERKLRAMLTSGSRLLTLIGTGGIGKTRLALRVARDEAEARGGFVRFVDLSAAYDLESVVGAVATSLSLSPKAGDPLELVAAALANRGALLLVLDNVEQAIVPAREALGCWIEKAPLVQFLVTSRMRTGLSDEVCFEVDPLSPEFALQLFRTRAEWIRPGLVLADAELSAAREAIELVDRIPLAIELAAARMRVMDAGQVVTALKRNARILTGGRAERHETLDVVIQGSWQLLDERGQRALAQCSVFEGGFTLEAAEAVVDLAGEPGGPSVDAVLRSLVDASLLRITRRQALAGGVQPLPATQCMSVFGSSRDVNSRRCRRRTTALPQSWPPKSVTGAGTRMKRARSASVLSKGCAT